MTKAYEEHLHLLTCIERLNGARHTLNTIEATGEHPLVGPAFRYALVEYATSFTRSDGPLKKRRKLSSSVVPADLLGLHQRILDARDQIHAHADLTALDAVLHVEHINGTKYVSRVENYVHGLEELENLKAIILLIESVLGNLHILERDSEARLVPNQSNETLA